MSTVRTRIAPSPTGSPHVGTAYIALFNYCFAKSQGGRFILRIEDTDQNRSQSIYEENILAALRWTGLSWDEGPDVGGPHGPYRQSERTDLYRRHAEILLDNGGAYKCFCTPERLDGLRQQQMRDGSRLGYDGHCLKLSQAEILDKEQAGSAFTVRLNVPESGVCEIQDPLRGLVTFDWAEIDHQVLMKSDGFPTYHLANVVDDHAMEISHVIRGEEWLPSLPKHLLLYDYFGWTPPQAIHLPLLRNEDSSKLSKRKNPTSILYYKELGILPEALLNFLGLMAYSMPDGQERFSLQDMAASFDIQRVSLGGPIFDLNKLKWVNQQHLAELSEDEICRRLIDWRFNPDYLRRLVPMIKPRLHRLGDFMQLCDFMFYSETQIDLDALPPKKKELEDTRDFLQKMIWEFEAVVEFNRDAIEQAIHKTASLHGWSVREATHALRAAVSGKAVAPPLYDVLEILGTDVTRHRLIDAVNAAGPLGKKKLAKLQKSHQAASAAYVAPA